MILAFAVGVATLILGFITSNTHAHKHFSVAVVTHTLSAGTVLSTADLTTIHLASPLPGHPNASAAKLVGKVLLQRVIANQPLYPNDVGKTAQRDGLSPNEVGLFLPVNLAASAEVVPGDRVVVFWTGPSGKHGGTPSGSALLSGARVLSVVTSSGLSAAEKGPHGAPSTVGQLAQSVPAAVELAVPTHEAGRLAVAASTGQIWLAVDPWGTQQTVLTNPAPTVSPTTAASSATASTSAAVPSTATASPSIPGPQGRKPGATVRSHAASFAGSGTGKGSRSTTAAPSP